MTQPHSVTVNARSYAFPEAPVVVVCIDGSEPDYMKEAVAAGRMPWLKAVLPADAREVRRAGPVCSTGLAIHDPLAALILAFSTKILVFYFLSSLN